MTTFNHFNELRPYKVWPGVVARALHGNELTMALVDLEADSVVAEHQHANEQLGFIVQGQLTFTIGGETKELHAGDAYVIPANVSHTATTGPEGAVVVDVFSPPRADWEAADRAQPSPSNWANARA